MHHLNMTCHVFSPRSCRRCQQPIRSRWAGGKWRLYLPPLAGLQAIQTTPVVAQTFRGVPTKIATTKKGAISNCRSAGERRGENGEGVTRGGGCNAPALIRANKVPMATLQPLGNAMQAIALERARGIGVDRLAPTILPRVDKAAVGGFAGRASCRAHGSMRQRARGRRGHRGHRGHRGRGRGR